MKKQFLQSAKVIILGLILAVGVGSAMGGWTPPTTAPTSGNTEQPINEGVADQWKIGGLALIGNFSIGGLFGNPAFQVIKANTPVINPTSNNVIKIGNAYVSGFLGGGGDAQIFLYGDQLKHSNPVPQRLCIAAVGQQQQVILCPVIVNGVCGSASGQPATNTAPGSSMPAPTTNLCSTGTATAVIPNQSNHDSWQWTCVGSGGTTASCGSNRNTIGAPGSQLYTPGATSGSLGTSHPTTFTVPVNVHSINVTAWGGGGSGARGGSGGNVCWGGGGGGGGSGSQVTLNIPVTPGQVISSISVGSGGATSNTDGHPGGATNFGIVHADGGNMPTTATKGGDSFEPSFSNGIGANGSWGVGGSPGGGNGTSGDCHGSGASFGHGGSGAGTGYGAGGAGGRGATVPGPGFYYGDKGSDGAVRVDWVAY